jgi:hypothetical protein
MKKTSLLLFAPFIALLFSCSQSDSVKVISKDGAIETTLNVDHLNDSADIITTLHNVWVKNVLVKSIVYKDTLPSLGHGSQDAENENGDSKTVYLQKDYEFYITVK